MFHLNKKISITILYVFTIVNLFGQTAFTHSEFSPQNGDTYNVGRATTQSPGSSGANQTWDFSIVNPFDTATHTVSVASYVPCSNEYPNATQAIGDGSYAMINVTSTDYELYGTTTTPGMSGHINSDPRKQFIYPMNYTDNFTDTYFGTDAYSVRYGSTTVTYDAYGTLTTPYGTYPNALRIHSYFTITDSGASYCTGTSDYYYWYVTGYKYPVAQIWSHAGSCGVGGGSQFLQSVSVGIEDNIENSDMVVFPNPFSNQTTVQIKNSLQNATLVIYNTYGQSVKKMYDISGQTITINRDDLTNGIYFMHLIQDNKTVTIEKLLITDF